jgi:NAD-dependent SIR2 family protein deacetylase
VVSGAGISCRCGVGDVQSSENLSVPLTKLKLHVCVEHHAPSC